MTRPTALLVLMIATLNTEAWAQIRVNPNGVNVNSQGATTVFLTFGGLNNQVAVEAFWCGELIPAAPDIGFKCDPSTIFGSLPVRFNQSRTSGTSGFTDIMSIPPSVARRAYQAAESGQRSSFYYVRRFVSGNNGPDEYVPVTCRMAGGGARVPLALLDVELRFPVDTPVLFVRQGAPVLPFKANIAYNGSGRLKGRWEVALPGDELPLPEDLLTEASLPIERRGLQRRYTQIDRFNVFLSPTGRTTLLGPDVAKLPTSAEGTYYILLRVEASDDKEADSNLATAGAGIGVVHSGGVAGFPMPVLRYIVGQAESAPAVLAGGLELLLPEDEATVDANRPLDVTWAEVRQGAVYRVEFQDPQQQLVHAALVQASIGTYRVPSWLKDKAPGVMLRWRVVAFDIEGAPIRTSPLRRLRLLP